MTSNPFKTESDLQAHLQRARAGWRVDPGGLSPSSAGTPLPGFPASEPESVLQGKIVKWAKDHGYPIQSNRQTRHAKGLLTPGWPDICLILKGRIVWIELKAGKGRMTEDQIKMRIRFLHLGHMIHEVRTWKRFVEIVQDAKQCV